VRRYAPPVWLAAAILLVWLLAGCGGRLSKAEYETKVRTVWAGVEQAFRVMNEGGKVHADGVVAAQAELRDAADELEDAGAPEKVEELNREIAGGMRQLSEDLEVLRAAAARSDQKAIDEFYGGLGQNPALLKIMEAAEEMKFMGYDLGSIAEE